MTDNNKTAIGIVLDKSGSMSMIRDDTIGGFNTFLQTQKESDGEATISMIQFSNGTSVTYDMADINTVEELSRATFRPTGGTALLDGMGEMIDTLGDRLADMPEDERPGSVIIAVMTDGEENSSREFTRDQIFEKIQHQKDVYNWEFIFLGTGQDAIQAGRDYGFDLTKSVNFSSNKMSQTMTSLGTKMSNYRSARRRGMSVADVSADLGYSQNDRDEVI